jgi:hypothetical protein
MRIFLLFMNSVLTASEVSLQVNIILLHIQLSNLRTFHPRTSALLSHALALEVSVQGEEDLIVNCTRIA